MSFVLGFLLAFVANLNNFEIPQAPKTISEFMPLGDGYCRSWASQIDKDGLYRVTDITIVECPSITQCIDDPVKGEQCLTQYNLICHDSHSRSVLKSILKKDK